MSRIPTAVAAVGLLSFLLQAFSVATMNEASSLPHVHPYSHVLPRWAPSPSLVTRSNKIYKTRSLKLQLPLGARVDSTMAATTATSTDTNDVQKLRREFLDVLRSRRTAQVPLTVIPGKPVKDPLYQDVPKPVFSAAMESCPKKEIPSFKDLIKEENFYLTTEAGEQGKLPVLMLSLKESTPTRRPVVVFLHSTHKCKEWLRPLLEAYASRGYITVAVDSRYHGERAHNLTTYRDALVSSWKLGDTMPFIYDTVWDLIKLADHLTQREDIDPSRIGITGESLGGMHALFAGAVDTRYSVVVPIIGVQGFKWALDHDKWQARVDSIKAVFEQARVDLGKNAIDRDVVEKVWKRITPNIISKFDAPYTVPAIAPRPLLILNGEEDPRCPIQGLEVPKLNAHKAYEKAGQLASFEFKAQPGIGHQMTPLMVKEASDWFDRFFHP